MRSSPERNKTPSPIKVKDYFTNPLHKIKQPAFTEVGFTTTALNTFVKNFTNRHNSQYISLTSIKTFIKSFTNNNPKLMLMYEQFFTKNFKQKEPGMIEVSQFMEFFVKETKLEEITSKNIKNFYDDIAPFNADQLLKKAESLEVPITEQEAKKIIKMVNYSQRATGKQIALENLQTVLREAQ